MENDDYLKKEFDILWNKVKENSPISKDPQPTSTEHNPISSTDFTSAFEQAEKEMQSESLRLLHTRFNKEKLYWENLVASKDEAIRTLQRDVQTNQEKIDDLKSKILELNNERSLMVQQTFTTVEMQRQSSNLKIEHLENQLEDSRRESMNLKLRLDDEIHERERTLTEMQNKEKKWFDDKDQRERDIEQIKQDLFKRRQEELDEIQRMDETIKTLQHQLNESRNSIDTEQAKLTAQINERETQIKNLQQELERLKTNLDKEREERKLATSEREHQNSHLETEKKDMFQQLVNRETKIKELQDSLKKMISDKESREEALHKREAEVQVQEENLMKRRENWLNSSHEQSVQHLEISHKVVNLIDKLETRTSAGAPRERGEIHEVHGPSVKPPIYKPVNSVASSNDGRPPRPWPRIFQIFKLEGMLAFFGNLKGMIFLIVGMAIFISAAIMLFMETEGYKAIRAQHFRALANEQYTKNDLVEAAKSIEKAYSIDPDDNIIKNFLVLIVGEMANRAFNEGRYDEALKHIEHYQQVMPEDEEMSQLRTKILQMMGKKTIDPQAPAEIPEPKPESKIDLNQKMLEQTPPANAKTSTAVETPEADKSAKDEDRSTNDEIQSLENKISNVERQSAPALPAADDSKDPTTSKP